MSILCALGLHKWNKYGPLVDAPSGLTQFRDCKRCGKIDYAKCFGNQADYKIANESINRKLEGEG